VPSSNCSNRLNKPKYVRSTQQLEKLFTIMPGF
jgi:hypothetical protein